MKLGILFFFFFFGVAFADFVCQDGVPYIENECNHCKCSKGLLDCTFMLCGNIRSEKCQGVTSYKKDCNTCYCIENNGIICTNYKC